MSEDAKAKLSAAAAPPIRLITLAADGREVKAGNETVLFRHEKTFYNPTGVFVRVLDTMPAAEITALAKAVADYKVDYVGMSLRAGRSRGRVCVGRPGDVRAWPLPPSMPPSPCP